MPFKVIRNIYLAKRAEFGRMPQAQSVHMTVSPVTFFGKKILVSMALERPEPRGIIPNLFHCETLFTVYL